MVEDYLHSPLECNKFAMYYPMHFSHLRYFKIKCSQYINRYRTNSPYISGDSIAKLTDYEVYGRHRNRKLSIRRLRNAKSIFVPGDLLAQFLEESKNFPIKARVLVVGNSDQNFDIDVKIPDTITLWLCQNNAIQPRPGLATLPIGLENLKLGRAGKPKYFKKFKEDAIVDRVLVPPMSPSNKIRINAVFYASQNPQIFDVRKNLMHESEYFAMTQNYRFVLCCEGNGYENHRIWETLYQGSFPVLLRTKWSASLIYLGLPILFIDKFEDLTKNMLLEFADKNAHFDPKATKELWVPYWKQIIKEGDLN